MKKILKNGFSLLMTSLLCSIAFAVPAFAETLEGHLDTVDANRITGWAWNKDESDDVLSIELLIYADGAEQAVSSVTLTADEYREDLHNLLGDGYHSFQYTINWSELEGTSFEVKAFAVLEDQRIPLIGSSTYTKSIENIEAVSVNRDAETGPGVTKITTVKDSEAEASNPSSLGIFTTTGYCTCDLCSNGEGLTYSGTVPMAEHTISADLNVLPLGSRVMIHDIIYTVEDIGSSVAGNKIDIYYGSHDEAWAHGVQQAEVFRID